MLSNIVWTFVAIVAALALYRYRHAIVARLKQFDADNIRRIAEQERDKADPMAHYRHTLATAEEQVEPVGEFTVSDARLGTPVTRFVFEGMHFGSRWEAENARAERIRSIAAGFYRELPRALTERNAPESVQAAKEPPPRDNVTPFRRPGETLH